MKTLTARSLALAATVLAIAGALIATLIGETPVGRVRGTLLAADTGRALPHVVLRIIEREKPWDEAHSYQALTEPDGSFAFPAVATGTYKMEADTQAHTGPTRTFDVAEGETIDDIVELPPSEPFIRTTGGQEVFTPDETPKVRVQGFVPTQELTLRLYRLSEEMAVEAWRGWLPGRGDEIRRAFRLPLSQADGVSSILTRAERIRGRDVEGVFRQDLTLETLAPGLYVLQVEGLPAMARYLFTVTDLGVIVKHAGDEALIYASDIKTGEPASGASVELLSARRSVASGETGEDGRLTLSLAEINRDEQTAIVARRGRSVAVATFMGHSAPANPPTVYTYTDRPAYRPGDTVHLKSIIRLREGDRFDVPAGDEVSLLVRDGSENTVRRATLTADRFGSIHDTFKLDPAALPGQYMVLVSKDGVVSEATFQVASYRKPEFSVKVATPEPRVIAGKSVRATVTATYYFGAPVPNARVRVIVSREPAWYYEPDPWDADEEATEPVAPQYGEDYYGGMEYVSDFSGRTDERGRFEVTIPTERRDEEDPGDQRYIVKAWVTDSAEREVDGESSVLATQGDFRIEAGLDRYVSRPGEPVDLQVSAIDYDGKPVGGVKGRAVMFRRTWERNHERRERLGEVAWAADAEGRATSSLTPSKPGDYLILASAEDSRGNRVFASAYAWVMSGDTAEFDYPYGALDVRADKKRYEVGDTVELVVNTQSAPQYALLTLEGRRLVESRVVSLEAKTTLLRISVTRAMMPAVRATVTFFRNKDYVNAETVLNVSRAPRALKVEVTSDRAVYEPGKTITYSVKTSRPDGTPTSAQVSLGVVDEALYALYPDRTTNITAAFLPRELYVVQTVYSYPRVYLSGDDKAGPGLTVRRRFEDTAYWNPTVETDASGSASVSFALPDNLTTWRATARAITMDTLAGQAMQKVVVQKPGMIRLQPPRFITQGDRLELLASVTNMLTESRPGSAGLERGSLNLEGSAKRDVDLKANSTETLGWWVTAPEPGPATVRAWMTGNRLSDAMESVIPVAPRGRLRKEGAFLTASGGTASSILNVRDDSVPGTASLTLRVSPTLLSSLLGGLEYLAEYPYGCTEQTVSAFLPDMGVARLAAREGIGTPAFRQRVNAMIRSGLIRLVGMQRYDGDWGWWSYDTGDLWMTAYATFALLTARDAGYDVSPSAIEKGLNATSAAATKRTMGHDSRAFAAWVLALGGNDAADSVLSDFSAGNLWRRRHLSDWGLAMLALATHERGRRDEARNTITGLWSRFTPAAYSPNKSRGVWYSDADYAAAMLLAACRITPEHPRLADLARRLTDYRRGQGWWSTRDTSFSIMALTRFADLTGELNPDNECVLTVNGREVGRKRFTSRDLLGPDYVVNLPASAVPVGPLRISVASRGRGRVYVAAELRQYTQGDLERAVTNASGLAVERHYRRLEAGARSFRSPGRPGRSETDFRSGDIVEVTLTVRSPQTYDYVMVEDPFPAAFEPQDRGRVESWEWHDWWAGEVVRDDRVAFAVRELKKGSRTITYRIRARNRGTFTALPPVVFDMYNPDARGEGAATGVRVR